MSESIPSIPSALFRTPSLESLASIRESIHSLQESIRSNNPFLEIDVESLPSLPPSTRSNSLESGLENLGIGEEAGYPLSRSVSLNSLQSSSSSDTITSSGGSSSISELMQRVDALRRGPIRGQARLFVIEEIGRAHV